MEAAKAASHLLLRLVHTSCFQISRAITCKQEFVGVNKQEPAVVNAEQSMPEEAHADPEGGEMLWYQCTTSVKGFSCRSQHKSEPCG